MYIPNMHRLSGYYLALGDTVAPCHSCAMLSALAAVGTN
jgi:hypothetical protein